MTSYSYMYIEWVHDHADEPVHLFSEIDEARWETRKVDIYRDGTKAWADNDTGFGQTGLSSVEMPSIEEIASDPQFKPRLITSQEFQFQWDTRGQRAAMAIRGIGE